METCCSTRKERPNAFPTTRQVPKTWCTSNGNFHTEGRGKLELKFFEYSNSKRVSIRPDVVEYDGDKLKQPVFDLILGTDTMEDFKQQEITIDEIALPMRDITNLPVTRKQGLEFNSLARSLLVRTKKHRVGNSTRSPNSRCKL